MELFFYVVVQCDGVHFTRNTGSSGFAHLLVNITAWCYSWSYLRCVRVTCSDVNDNHGRYAVMKNHGLLGAWQHLAGPAPPNIYSSAYALVCCFTTPKDQQMITMMLLLLSRYRYDDNDDKQHYHYEKGTVLLATTMPSTN